MTAVDAWTQDPDPDGAPQQRTLAERRADDLDEALDLDDGDEPVDELELVRRRIRRAELHRRRRTHRRVRPRSGVTVNVHLDLRTLAGTRDLDDLDDLVLRGEGWRVTKHAAEQFSRRQRRALAARDGHCVFPSCTRAPRFCDAHHLQHRKHGGPTRTDNAALLCRFHHRLVHEHHWTLAVDDTGRWTATDRHGATWTGGRVPTGDGRPRAPQRPADQSAA